MTFLPTRWALSLCLLLSLSAPCAFSQTLVHPTPLLPLCGQNANLPLNDIIGSNVDAGLATQTGGDFSDQNILVDGDFTIDRDVTFKNCTIQLAPGATIVVRQDPTGVQERTLRLDNSQLFSADCGRMWAGIVLQRHTLLDTRNLTRIEDAETAILAEGAVRLSLAATTFNRNRVGLRLQAAGTELPVLSKMQGVHFDCSADLNDKSAGAMAYAGIVSADVPVLAQSTVGAVNVTFSRLRFGILDASTGTAPLSINGWGFKFDRIQEDAIKVIRGNLDLRDCYFQNGEGRGINAETIYRLVLQNGKVFYDEDLSNPALTTNRIGIFIKNLALGAKVQITKTGFHSNNAQMSNRITGIWLDGKAVGAGADVQIDHCSFDFTGQRFFGIYLNGIFPQQSQVQIFGNSFTMEALGNNVETVAINCVNGEKNNVQIFENGPFDGKTGGGRAYTGICLSGSSGSGNTVKDNNFPTDYTYIGEYWNDNMSNAIFATDFENTAYCGNTLGDCAVLLRMAGNDLGTQLYNNTLRGGSRSLLVNGFIGAQGAPGRLNASGNQWFRKYPFLSATSWAECSVQPELQPLTVHTPPTPVDAQKGSFNPSSGVIPGNWFEYNLESSPADCSDALLAERSGSNPLDDRLAEGGDLDATPAQRWQMERHLYARLQNTPESDVYPQFIDQASRGNIGRFFVLQQQISKALTAEQQVLDTLERQQAEYEQIATQWTALADANEPTPGPAAEKQAVLLRRIAGLDSHWGNLQTQYQQGMTDQLRAAARFNQSIPATTVFEDNEKAVTSFRLKHLLPGNSQEQENDLADLRRIAAQWPREGGLAVHTARGLLPAEEQLAYTNEELGYQPDNLFAATEHEAGALPDLDLRVYPNPASEWTLLSLPEDGSGQLRLYASNGQLVLEQAVAAGENRIELGQVPAGLYDVQVTAADGRATNGKLVVQR